MKRLRSDLFRSLALAMTFMLVVSMMSCVMMLSANSEEDNKYPKVINAPALTYSGIYDCDVHYDEEKDEYRYSHENMNTKMFNLVFDDEETELKIEDIESINYTYTDDDLNICYGGDQWHSVSFRVVRDFDMVLCSMDLISSLMSSDWDTGDDTMGIIHYGGLGTFAEALSSLRRGSLTININYSDGTTDTQKIGLVEDNLHSYYGVDGYTEVQDTEYNTELKTFFADGYYNQNGIEYEIQEYELVSQPYYNGYYTVGAAYNITTKTGIIKQTLSSLLVRLAHSRNIDNDSILEMDNAIIDLTEGSATTNRYYVDIDSKKNVVLPMNTMSEIAELVQTRVGDNIVYNTESSVDFDRPVQSLADGTADLCREFTFDLTKDDTLIPNVRATEEDMHLLAQKLFEHTDFSESGVEVKYGRIAELNGELISLPDELFYNGSSFAAETANLFSGQNRNQLMLDLIDNGYVLQDIGRKRIPGTNYTVGNTDYLNYYPVLINQYGYYDLERVSMISFHERYFEDYREFFGKDYHTYTSNGKIYFPIIEDESSLARSFRITVDISNTNKRNNVMDLVNRLSALEDDDFESQVARNTFNEKSYYSRAFTEFGYGLTMNPPYPEWISTRDRENPYLYNNMSITYGEYGLIQSGIKNGNSQYLQWEIASSELKKLVLTFSSNNYELMNKYLDIISDCGLSVIGNESYMPDFENATKISVRDFLGVTENIGNKDSYVSINKVKYAKYGEFTNYTTENTDKTIKDTYDGYQISFPLEMLNNKEKGVPYNVINQVMIMDYRELGVYDTSKAEWSYKGNVFYLDGEFIRNYNSSFVDKNTVGGYDYNKGWHIQTLSEYTLVKKMFFASGEKGQLRHTEYKWGEVVLASRPDPVVDLSYDPDTRTVTWTKPVDEGYGVETIDNAERTKKDDKVYVHTYTIRVTDEDGNITFETVIKRDKKSDDVEIVIPEEAISDATRKHTITVYCTNIIGDSDERKVEFVIKSAVEIKMTPDKPLYREDETVIYTETVTNTGDVKLTKVTVDQELPGEYVPQEGLDFIGSTAFLPDLEPGESYTFYYKVPASVAVDKTIINDAEVTTAQKVTDEDTCTVHTYTVDDNTDTEKSDINESDDKPKPQPKEYDIEVTTTANKKVYNDLEYIYVVTNTGEYTLTNVVVSEHFDKGEYINTANGNLNDDGTVTVAKLEPGKSVTLIYKINAADAPVEDNVTVTNLVTAVADEGVDDDDSTVVAIIHYSIEVTKLVDNRKHIKGDNVIFTNIVKNDGNTILTNIVVTEDLDGTFKLTNGAVIVNDYIVIAELAPGESYTYQYIVPANDKNITDGRITGTVTATASEDSIAESSDNVSDSDTNYAIIYEPAIEVTKTVEDRIYRIGETVVWVDTITNNGDIPLTNIVVTENLNGIFDVPYDTTENSFVIPMLDVGESYRYTFSTVITEENISDKIHSTTVEAVAAEGVSDNDTAKVKTELPAIKVDKTVTKYEYTPDETVIYTDVITNTGDVTLTEVVVKENHPGIFTDFDPIYKADHDTLIIYKIDVGDYAVVKYEVKVSDVDYSENNTITSIVTATAKENVSDNDSVDVIVEAPQPEIIDSGIDKSTESESNTQTDTSSDIESDTQTDTSSDIESDTMTDTSSDTESDTLTDTSSDTESDTLTDTSSDTESDTLTDTSSDTESDTLTDTSSDTESDTQTDTSSDTESDTQTDTSSDTESDTQTDTSSNTQTDTDSNTDKIISSNVDSDTISENEIDSIPYSDTDTITSDKTETDTNTETDTGSNTDNGKNTDSEKSTDNKTNTNTTVSYTATPQSSGNSDTGNSVKTGDDTNTAALILVLFTSIVTMSVLCYRRKED